MKTFGDYSRYYNLLYADKAYDAECGFVLDLMQRHGSRPATLLDLGCGTGNHDFCFAGKGLRVSGLDISDTMLACARERCLGAPGEPLFFKGDVRSARLGQVFDAVTSLFHVMSYQRTEEDAMGMLRTAYEHLPEGGLFLFDFWHGPGVLSDPPEVREKCWENEQIRVERTSRPEVLPNDNLVVVHFDVRLTDKANDQESRLREEHPMRYWFLPELRFLARQSGFTVVSEGGWMHGNAPSPADWYAWMLVRR